MSQGGTISHWIKKWKTFSHWLICAYDLRTLYTCMNGPCLTHWGQVIPGRWCIYAAVVHHWIRQWLVACSAPSHYLTNADILSTRPWGTYFNEISFEIRKVFIQENEFENVVCTMAAIVSRTQCVNEIIILNLALIELQAALKCPAK